jgi:hypothetical protein
VRFEVTRLCLLVQPTLEVDFHACFEIGDRVGSIWLGAEPTKVKCVFSLIEPVAE